VHLLFIFSEYDVTILDFFDAVFRISLLAMLYTRTGRRSLFL